MFRSKVPPHIDNILWLRALARPFPTTAGEILKIATEWNFSNGTLSFLSLFPENEIFETGDDFLSRSQNLEMLLLDGKQVIPTENLVEIQS